MTCPPDMESLCAQHLDVIRRVVLKYRHCGVAQDELESQGLIGLAKAARAFDPSKGFEFAALAWWCVKCEVVRVIHRENRQIHCLSLDAPINETRNITFGDTLASDAPAPWDALECEEATDQQADTVHRLVRTLPDAQRYIIAYRYGLFGQQQHAIKEIAAHMSITPKAAESRIYRAIYHLKKEVTGNAT